MPTDVVGLVGRAEFRIGDTLAEDPKLAFDAIPSFPPECFAWLHCVHPPQQKRFRQGVEQLLQEGVMQAFQLDNDKFRAPFLGAVGPLQFEVLQYRLQSEYGAESRLEITPWTMLRWVVEGTVETAMLPSGGRLAADMHGTPVILFTEKWGYDYFVERRPEIKLSETSPVLSAAATSKRRN